MSGLLLQAAQGIEHKAGVRAGLHAYRALIGRGRDGASAHLAALRCAGQLGDEELFAQLLSIWPAQSGAHALRVAALARRLAKAGRAGLARDLLDAERRRWNEHERHSEPAARLLYLATTLARSRTEKRALYTELGAREDPLGQVARLRLAELLRDDGEISAALQRIATIEKSALEPHDRLRLADLQLLSGSRFTRAAAFSEFAEHVHDKRALLHAVRGIVHSLPVLTALEWDRARAVFSRIEDETRRARWLAWCDAVRTMTVETSAQGAGAELCTLHIRLRELLERLADAQTSAEDRSGLEARLGALLRSGAIPSFGFAPLALYVRDPRLQRDLIARATAAREPQHQALLEHLSLQLAYRALEQGDPRGAYAMLSAVPG